METNRAGLFFDSAIQVLGNSSSFVSLRSWEVENFKMILARKPIRILFVENSPEDIALTLCELRRGGFEPMVDQVQTAEAMRTALEKEVWDVILCDHSLPHFNSTEALQIFKESKQEIPFVIISGTLEEECVAQAMRAGADDYLSKNNMVRLVPVIERELRQMELRREHRRAEESIQRSHIQTIRYQETLLRLSSLAKPDFEIALNEILKTDAETLELERVSFWSLQKNCDLIICESLYLKSSGRRERGMELRKADYPRYFDSMETSPLIVADDAQKDSRTFEFAENYLKPLGITSMLDVPVWLEGKLAGVVCHEHVGEKRNWSEADQKFAVSIGHMVALALGEQKRKQAETALQRSQQDYESLVNSLEGIVWEADAQTFQFTFVSQEAERLLGYPLHRWKDEPTFWSDHIHPEDRDWAVELCSSSTARGEDHSFEYRMIAADGRSVWLRDLVKVFNENGKPKKMRGVMVEITQLKEAESALRESESQLRSIVETTPECVKIIDRDGNLLQMNQAGLEMVECSDLNLIRGKSVMSIIAAEHRDAFRQLNEKVCNGERVSLQFEIVGLRGGRRWLETNSAPIRNPSDGTLRHLGITRDITAVKRSEIRQQVFASLMQNLNSATHPKEAARIISESAEKLLGWDACSFDLYSAEPPKLQPILNLDTIDDQHVEVSAVPKIYDPNPFTISVINEGGKLILRDGTSENPEKFIPFGNPSLSASLIFVPVRNGTQVTGILSIQSYKTNAYRAEDVEVLQSLADHCGGALERIAAQEAQRQLMDTVEIQHKRLDDMLANVPGVVWEAWTDPDGQQVNFTNKYIEKLLGYTSEEWVNTPSFWMSIVHPEDWERVAQKSSEILERAGQGTDKFRWIAKDGRVVWVEAQFKAICDPSGKPIGLCGVTIDISERLELETQLRQSQKMESVGQLAGGIAHDFNNILTVIQGHSSLLRSSDNLTEFQNESAEQIALAADRAANLTRQLLTFSRRQVMQTRALDLNEVVNNFIKMLRRVVGEDISLQVNYSPSTPMVYADSGMMEQLLMNLAVNSRDAMPKGGRLTIETSTLLIDHTFTQQNSEALLGEAICITVKDTGCGISPENLTRIYEPFFTTKGVGQGTGLGLATVYGIVKQHRGWIKVESEVGKGTTFQIFIPASKEAKNSPKTTTAPTAVRGGTETILLVEDELPVRNLVGQILKQFGYSVLEADSGVTALKVWKQNRDKIHLLLTDMVMPDGMTGRDLAEIVQFDQPEIKVIFTSGYNAEIVGKDFNLHDGLNFLQKPYQPKKLAKAVRDCLDGVAITV